MTRLIAVLATITLSGCASSANESSGAASGSVSPLPSDQVVLSIDYGDFVDQVELVVRPLLPHEEGYTDL